MPTFAREQILTLTTENDAYTQSGDGQYTNGLRLSWLDADNRLPGWVRVVTDVVPFFEPGDQAVPVYTLGHNIYTPNDIEPFLADSEDRPYAGYLYGSVAVTGGTLEQVDNLEVSFGWVGPGAMGEGVQSRYHELIGVQKPNGWKSRHLEDEPALGLSWQRRWPRWQALRVGEQGLISTMPHVGMTVGNVYTHATAGATVSWRSNGGQLADMPIRVAPGVPGTGYFETQNRLNWQVFAGAEGRAVARNIFLDGNTFRDSPSVRKRNLVGDLSAGVMLTYGNYQLGYTTVYRTEEFYGQPGGGQVFGAISLGYKF